MIENNETIFGRYTRAEIYSQPQAWSDAIEIMERNKKSFERINLSNYDQILFTGCGSTYYLSLSAASLFQELNLRLSKAIPASELFFNPGSILANKNTLLFAVSRSGSTTETVKAVEQFRKQKKGFVISLTCYEGQPLNKLADLEIVLTEGKERSVAQTKSFSSLFLAATWIATLFSPNKEWQELFFKLPEAGKKIIQKYEDYARWVGEQLNLDRFYFLGSGPRYGLCCETNLKMKEMSLTHSEPFHFLEFRHGPMSMVTPTTQIIGMLSESNRKYELRVLEEMSKLGANITRIAEDDAAVEFSSGLPEPIRNVLYLPVLQLMAYFRSLKKGLNPDQPKNLNAVVNLDL